MRRSLLALVAGLALAGCGPVTPKEAASGKTITGLDDPGAMWPLLNAHCLRSPSCDPTADFGRGAGEASDSVDQVTWFVQTKDVVKEGGEDYGALIQVSLYGLRASGGKAGRPITLDEAPATLNGANAMRSILAIEYRTPGGGPPEPYFLQFESAQVALAVPGVAGKTQEQATDATYDWLDAIKPAMDCDGAVIEITGRAGILHSDCSLGMPASETAAGGDRHDFEPWSFYISRNLRDEPLPALVQAIEAGETLGLKILGPGGDIILQDAIYSGGYAEALKRGAAALADPQIATEIAARCQPFAGKAQESWKIADVTPALHVCDPRTPQQRARDAAPNAPASPVPASPAPASRVPGQ